ncbi:hypothetical protein [Streptomyces sp. NPDC059786]|uniref:hypothetical protein n=1 Tax=Streptomyces sp. NPDC059786 TaxID=3346946 RepID=UPI003667780B
MAPNTDHQKSVRAERQLRRIRSFYAAGVLLWAASSAWTGWKHPGSTQMWACALFTVVFAGLLAMASVWLRRIEDTGAGRARHHAAPRHRTTIRHVNA